MRLVAALWAFYLEHRLCGPLKAGLGDRVIWFDWQCGARLVRRMAGENAPPWPRR